MSCVFDEVVRAAGSISALQRALGEKSKQAVFNWRARGFPIPKCKQVEALTGISVIRLRPRDWHLIWPELIGAEGAPPVPPTPCPNPQPEASHVG